MQLQDPTIFDNFFEPILIIDKDWAFKYVNEAFAKLFGVSQRRLKVGASLESLLPGNFELLKGTVDSLGLLHELKLVASGGDGLPVQACAEQIELDGAPAFLIFIRDIGLEQKLQRKYKLELQQKEQFIQKLDRKLFEVSFLLEMSNTLSKQDRSDEVFSWALNLVADKFTFKRAAFLQMYEGEFRVVASRGEQKDHAFWNNLWTTKNQDWIYLSTKGDKGLQGIMVLERNDDLSTEDIELLRTAAEQIMSRLERELLYSTSITDEKTGLYNVRFLQRALEHEISDVRASHSAGGPAVSDLGLIILDIDHFKKVNDTYGHPAGDEVLVNVAQILKSCARTGDVVARFGGEEFCLLGRHLNAKKILDFMEEVRSKVQLAKTKIADGKTLQVTASLGGAIFATTQTAEELFAKADAALYEAKRSGRNQSKI